MAKKLATSVLRANGLALMRRRGTPLQRHRPIRGQIFQTPDGTTVRLRTSNDRVLTVRGSDPNPQKAALDIDGTDFVLLVVPTELRGTAAIEAYFLPTALAAEMVKTAHLNWLQSEDVTTKGANQTFCVWLDKVPSGGQKLIKEIWAEYHIGRMSLGGESE